MLAVPGDNPAQIESLADLARPGLLLVLGAPDVPVRTYTDEVLEALAIDPAFGEDYREAVLANLVSEEANVRQVVAKIALGEADAGIVYGSDITPDLADRVLALPISDGVNPTIKYPIVMINDTARPELAMAFIDFVLSQAGQETLLAWGFCPLASGEDSEMRGRVDVTPEAKTTDTHQDEETLHAC